MVKKIVLPWPVTHLSNEIQGFDYIKFLSWHSNKPPTYALGNGPVKSLQRGLELRLYEDLFIFRENGATATLLVSLR